MGPLRSSSADDAFATHWWQARGHGADAPQPLAIHPGSGGAAKRWPPERFAELIGRAAAVGWPVVAIEGPQDAEVSRTLLAALPPGVRAPDIARGLSVGALATLLARCAAFVGNDSGVAHLAGLAGVRTLALFGPTDPAIWSPLGLRVSTLRAPAGELTQLLVSSVWQALGASHMD